MYHFVWIPKYRYKVFFEPYSATMNAINLYLALGCADIGVFNKEKDASACIGLTPIQHSSGGMVKLGSIGNIAKIAY